MLGLWALPDQKGALPAVTAEALPNQKGALPAGTVGRYQIRKGRYLLCLL